MNRVKESMDQTTTALVEALRNYLAAPTRVAGAAEDAFTRIPVDSEAARLAHELLRKLTK